MEYQFEIVGKDNREMVRRLHRVVFDPYMKLMSIAMVACGLAMMLLGWQERDIPRMAGASVYFFAPLLARKLPVWVADRAYKERLKYYNGETPAVTARFGENLVMEDVDSSRTIPYEKITNIHYIQDAVVIQVGKQLVVGIPCQNFIKGTLPELKQFLRE